MRPSSGGKRAAVATIIARVDLDLPVSKVYERGRSAPWVGEVTEEVPGLRLAWRGAEGFAHTGVATFHHLAGDATRVVVQVDWEPHGAVDKVADTLSLVKRKVETELERFRDELEAQPRTPSAVGTARPVRAMSGNGDGRGRGRHAEAPTDIPAAGWKDVLSRTMAEVKQDHMPILAAGVAFYLMLSLFPALVAVLSIYGLVVEPGEVGEMLAPVVQPLPSGIEDLINEQLTSLTTASERGLGIGLAVSLAAAVWSASKGMKSLIDAINAAFDEEETRKFIPLRGLALVLTLGGIVLMVASVALLTVVPGLAEHLGSGGRLLATIVRWPLLAVIMIGALAVLYRYTPDRDDARWRWVTPGAVVATVLWMIGSGLFAVYADNFGKFNETYGSLGAVVVLLLWLNLTAYVILFGAELNAETERQTKKDTTEGRPRRMGQRDAYAADTVGPTAEQVKAAKG